MFNCLDLGAQPQRAQNGATITCRVTVDGVVRDERTSDGVNAQTFCVVKSA